MYQRLCEIWGRWIGFGSRCGSSVFWSGTGETQCQEGGERMFWMGGGDVEVDSGASVGYTQQMKAVLFVIAETMWIS